MKNSDYRRKENILEIDLSKIFKRDVIVVKELSHHQEEVLMQFIQLTNEKN